MALFWTAIRKDSVSLLRLPFLSHVHVFSWEMSLVSRIKIHTVVFLSIFAYGYFRSIDLHIIIIIIIIIIILVFLFSVFMSFSVM